MIEPTVGRVVWYFAGVNDVRLHKDGVDVQPAHAALVVDVADNTTISVCAFGRDGYPNARTYVRLLQNGDKPPTDGSSWCEWMPFQKGQAAKTEAAEKAAAAVVPARGPFGH